jgi:hypothetical protein
MERQNGGEGIGEIGFRDAQVAGKLCAVLTASTAVAFCADSADSDCLF